MKTLFLIWDNESRNQNGTRSVPRKAGCRKSGISHIVWRHIVYNFASKVEFADKERYGEVDTSQLKTSWGSKMASWDTKTYWALSIDIDAWWIIKNEMILAHITYMVCIRQTICFVNCYSPVISYGDRGLDYLVVFLSTDLQYWRSWEPKMKF